MRTDEEEKQFQTALAKYGKMGMAESFAEVAIHLHRIEKKIITKEELIQLLNERLGSPKA